MVEKTGRFEKQLEGAEAGRAPATILRVTQLLPGTPAAGESGGTFRARVRVEPVDDPAFEASVTMHVTVEPRVGGQIPVVYHEGSVAWDPEPRSVSGT